MAEEKVLIFDTTLRDGEQSPGASLSISEKLEIAHQLAVLGVDIIEAGFPVSSPAQFEATQVVAEKVAGPDVVLSWRAGRGAAMHGVYLSSKRKAVVNGAAYVHTVSEASYDPGTLQLDQTYYWKINEVNEAESPSSWEGDLWSFSTVPYLVVDDFESYTDDVGNRVFQTWLDGFGYSEPEPGYGGNGTGSGMGNAQAPFMETNIVHSGSQSAPFSYDNTGSVGKARYSETERTWAVPQDWTRKGVKALTLWFHGDPANSAEPLYVAVQDSFGATKAVTHENPNAVLLDSWQEWNIDLKEFSNASVNLTSIKTVYIGVGNRVTPRPGGTGKLYFDDIRLYPSRCVPSIPRPSADLNDDCVVDYLDLLIMSNDWLAAAVAPSNANLVVHYQLDGDATDSSGHGHHGSLAGDPQWAAGMVGTGAADLDGDGDEIDCGDVSVTDTGHMTIAFWAMPGNVAQDWAGIVSKWGDVDYTFWLGQHADDGWIRFGLYLEGGRAETSVDTGKVVLSNGKWSHIVCTYDGHFQKIYANGQLVASSPDRNTPMTNYAGTLRLGNVPGGTFFNGLIDDARIYNYALSSAEVLSLNGIGTDLYEDDKVDLKDYAVLSDQWLAEQLWP